MRGHGIHVSAVTPQNEPLNARNEPSMVMTRHGTGGLHQGIPWTGIAQRRARDGNTLLGPQLRRTGISAHGAGGRGGARLYRRRCLAFVQRIAGGDVGQVRAQYPEQKVYFTEQWVSAHDDFMGALRWHTKNVVIGTLRNWSRTALEWNLASDPRYAFAHAPRRRGSPGRRYHQATIAQPRRRGRLYRRGHDQAKSRILPDGALGEVHPAGVGAGSFKRGGSASQRDLSDA